LFGFDKDKVRPLAVIMDKPGQSLAVSVIHAAGRKYCNCHMRASLLHLGWSALVINQLRLDFGAFTCYIVGSDFARLLLTVRTQNSFFGKEVMCVSTGQPTRCEYVKR
jgi:hypothetical protein